MNTNKVLLGAAALLMASAAGASAQSTTGTVNVTGSVASKCVVISGAFNDTISLNELAEADGTLSAALEGTTAASPAGFKTFQVSCNGGTPTVTLTATSLANAASIVAGYSNTVRYTAQLDATKAVSGTDTHTFDTATNTGTATSATAMTGPLANAADNIKVSLYALSAPNASDLLISGAYSGAINVVIAPN